LRQSPRAGRSMPDRDGSCRYPRPRTLARPRRRARLPSPARPGDQTARCRWWPRSGPGSRSSSAETTNSSGPSRSPTTQRWYKSSTTPALAAKSGAREDPRPVPPRLEGVLIQPAPHGADTDLLHQPTGDGLLAHVSDAEAAQRDRPQRGQLTGDRLDLRDDHRGERPAASFGGGYTQNLRDEAPNRPSSRISSLFYKCG
jgi:hypothetical protein